MDNLSDLQAKALEMAKEKGFLSVAQVATLVGKSIRAVREDCNRLGCYEKTDKTGYMIPPEDIEKFIRQRKPPKKQQTKPLPVEESDLKGSLIAGIDNEANKITSPIVATATEKINLDPNVNDNANESIKNNYGYILLHRRIMDWKWFKKPSRNDPSTFIVFLYLLMKANYEDSLYKAKGIIIERGCLVTGIRSMEKDLEGLGVTIQNIRTALKHLEDTKEIKREPTDDKQASIITIVNYNRWQAKQNTSNTPKKTLHDYMRDRVKPEYHHTEEETEQAKETLDYFNQVTHHTYRYNESNLDPIIIRVREGWNAEDLRYALEDILDMDDSTQCTEETDPATHLKRVFVNDFATLQKRTKEREREGG